MYSSSDHTFVICAYKQCAYLEECIQSVLRQTQLSRVLIATSTPNESIRTLAQRYNIELLCNDQPPSIAGDWNFGLNNANTALVTLCHQDDILHEKYLEIALSHLNGVPHPSMLFTDYAEIRQREIVTNNINLRLKRALLLPLRLLGASRSRFIKRRILSLGNPICCPSVLYVKTNLPLPLFHGGLRSNLDWQAWERIAQRDGAFVYCPEQLLFHRIHAGSETTLTIEANIRTQEDLFMFRKFWPLPIARLLTKVYATSEKANRVNTAAKGAR